MTMWTPDLSGRPGPVYRAIADAMAADLQGGRLKPGERLPTHRDLAFRLGVTVGTVSRGYAEAERRGLIAGHVGRGTYVRWPGPEARSGEPMDVPDDVSAAGPDHRRVGAFARYYEETAAVRGRYNLSLNYPFGPPLADALQTALARITARATIEAVAGYQPSNGMPAHRIAAAGWLARFGIAADPDRTLIVPGAQGGLMTIFMAVARPGDTVLAEALTWPGLLASADAMGLRVCPVAVDEEGLCPDAFDAACRRHKPRLLYLMPTLHNPRTTVMPQARRHAVAAVAARHGVWVIEDDVYGFLLDEPMPPLRTLLPHNGLYVTSLSKCVAPGLRVGFLDAPAALVPRLASALRCSTLMTSPVSAELAAEVIRCGAAEAAASAQREETRRRQSLAAARLAGLGFRTNPNGFHLWLAVPEHWKREEFVGRLSDRGVAVTPGTAFAAGDPPDGEALAHVRVCLCAIAEVDRLAAALDLIVEVAHAHDRAIMPVV